MGKVKDDEIKVEFAISSEELSRRLSIAIERYFTECINSDVQECK